MPRLDEIRKAIRAHGLWTSRLRDAITSGKADVTPALAALDDACELDQWLHALPAAEQKDPHFAKVRELHAMFHREAAAVLELVEAGKTAQASRAIESGSALGQVTMHLTMTLMDWSQAG